MRFLKNREFIGKMRKEWKESDFLHGFTWVLQVQDILGRWKQVAIMAPSNFSDMVNAQIKESRGRYRRNHLTWSGTAPFMLSHRIVCKYTTIIYLWSILFHKMSYIDEILIPEELEVCSSYSKNMILKINFYNLSYFIWQSKLWPKNRQKLRPIKHWHKPFFIKSNQK